MTPTRKTSHVTRLHSKLTGEEILMTLLDAHEALNVYRSLYPAFQMKPIGAPYSNARKNQQYQIECENGAKLTMERIRSIIREIEESYRVICYMVE